MTDEEIRSLLKSPPAEPMALDLAIIWLMARADELTDSRVFGRINPINVALEVLGIDVAASIAGWLVMRDLGGALLAGAFAHVSMLAQRMLALSK